MNIAGLASDLAVGLAGAGIASWVGQVVTSRRAAKEDEIWRIVRHLKQDLDRLADLDTHQSSDTDEIDELRSRIRAHGEEAHEIDGRRGMDSLLRKVADLDLAQADFYEMKVDKIWNFIGYENGRISRRGIWVA